MAQVHAEREKRKRAEVQARSTPTLKGGTELAKEQRKSSQGGGREMGACTVMATKEEAVPERRTKSVVPLLSAAERSRELNTEN